MSSNLSIETHDLTKRFGAQGVVNGLNLRVRKHQITGFLGRNGAGKSTTIKMLLGMIHPSSGAGTVLGRRIDVPKESCDMRRYVAYVAEDKQLYSYMSVAEMIRFTRSFYPDWRGDVAESLLRHYQLPPRGKIGALSKGMRTKLALLLALARRPELLILDEPSEGLDPASIEELLQALIAAAAEGTTVFFSSHQIAEVERIADRICVIEQGRVVSDLALDAFRQHYRRVTIGFSTSPPPLAAAFPNVEDVQVEGRQLRLLVRCDAEAIAAQARNLGAVSVDVEPITVREFFLHRTRKSD